MKKLYVEFYSPGTFVSEVTSKEIDSQDIDKAIEMAHEIVERHGARPYGFRFVTYELGVDDKISKKIDQTGIFWLGGKLRTAEEILNGTDPNESILRSNVRINEHKMIIENTNSWKFTSVFDEDKDVLLDVKLKSQE